MCKYLLKWKRKYLVEQVCFSLVSRLYTVEMMMPSKQHLWLLCLFFIARPLKAKFNVTSPGEKIAEKYGTKQTVKCYDQFNGYGNSLELKYPVSDLWTYGWDNRISSCCFTGFWLMYEYKDYNQFNPNVRPFVIKMCMSANVLPIFN